MQVIEKIEEMQALAKRLCVSEGAVALVPTMGSLHEGHLSLIKTARERAQHVVVSIFVNPKQFGPNEDFGTYPREPEHDLDLCREAGVDVVFMPDSEDFYPKDYSTYITEETISKLMCGISRPQHFRGVTTVVGKLFNLVRPDFAVFGQKDAQQVAIIRKMVRELHFGVEIVVCETVREEDGLAKSSRNKYLSKVQRSEAAVIPQSLQTAREMVESGTRITDRVIAEVTHILGSKRRIRIIYVTMTDPDTMEPMREIVPGKTLLALAVWVDEVRLIDNILV
ncbi:MAG TPA: pantoate--beta-alanine ligase [Opitutales bacterium]|nr:pantoate--beta-alanine ligase [Opitutales bacterium]